MSKLYIKILLGTGIPFAILMGIVIAHDHGASTGFIYGTFSGLIFGVGMSLVFGTIQILTVKKKRNPSNTSLSTKQVRNIHIDTPFTYAIDRCVGAIKEIKGFKIINVDKEAGVIAAKSRINWLTWGEEISIHVREKDSNSTNIRISSQPLVKTTLVDYGKNARNIEILEKKILYKS